MTNFRRALGSRNALVLVGLLSSGLNGVASAETLAEALAIAYRSNPQLQQSRAQQRVLDESYVQALAVLRPSLSFNGSAQYQNAAIGKSGVELNNGQATLTASQPHSTRQAAGRLRNALRFPTSELAERASDKRRLPCWGRSFKHIWMSGVTRRSSASEW